MPLTVTQDLVQHAGARLREGGWRYTRRQLYYATCAEAEIPPNHAASTGQIGLGVLLILIGAILINLPPAGYVVVALGLSLMLVGIASRFRRRPPLPRVLALSYGDFAARFGGITLDGLLSETSGPVAAASEGGVAVICDTNDTAAIVAANREHAGLHDVRVVRRRDAGAIANATMVLCLHDASPAGCALVAELRDTGVPAIDAGLRPCDVAEFGDQIIEGAPARMPRDLGAVLEAGEVEWLLSGRRVELASKGPEAILEMVRAAAHQTST